MSIGTSALSAVSAAEICPLAAGKPSLGMLQTDTPSGPMKEILQSSYPTTVRGKLIGRLDTPPSASASPPSVPNRDIRRKFGLPIT